MPSRDRGRLVGQLEDLREKLGTWKEVAERLHNPDTGKHVNVRTLFKWMTGEIQWPQIMKERIRRLHRYHVQGHK